MKNAYKKIKSLALVYIMLFSMLTAIVVLPNQNVRAVPLPTFSITAPTAGTDYNKSVTTSLNITWGTPGTNQTLYDLTINGVLKQNSTARYYVWDISTDEDVINSGNYIIKVYSFNDTSKTKRYASNNVTVYINSPPGVTEWGNATTDLKYGVSYSSVSVNTSKWNETGDLFLYYPVYTSNATSGFANTFRWVKYGMGDPVVYPKITTAPSASAIIETGGAPITFNRAGMWIFDNNGHHAGNDPTTYAGYIWVNTSTNYSIESVSDFNYGDAGSKTITVNTGSDTGCMIAITNPVNRTVYHKWRVNGVSDGIKIEAANFSMAGDYTVKAYRDFDAQNSTYYYPDENFDNNIITDNYSEFYGSRYSTDFPTHPVTNSEYYNYSLVGPWDPPEKNAAEITFSVSTGEPIVTLTNTTI
jgi:hypothetical protein